MKRATDFEAVIVGSGFGASVMAYRLAEAGLRVCVLERGKSYPPGSFPRSPHHMRRNFWDPSEGLYGMFSLWSFSGLDALVSSGLGGGSLIYANVLLRKDEHWFIREEGAEGGEYWPITRADLDPHYDRAERMLGARPYPFQEAPYRETPKTRLFREAATRLKLDWQLPNLAVTFGNSGERPTPGVQIKEDRPNLHGLPRYACRLTGECDIGCNFGSKNSVDYNYLSEAQRLGAEIRTLHEVRQFRPRAGGGFEVDYVVHDLAREGRALDTADPRQVPVLTLTADRLILAAGTLGSTYLLLRSRADFPGISQRLGSRFSGNGDLLGLAINCTEMVEGRRRPLIVDGALGPVITSAIRVPDAADGGDGRGYYIEDAGYPEFASWMIQMLAAPATIAGALPVVLDLLAKRLLRRPERDLSAEVSRLFGSTDLSSSLLPLLGMGRDVPDGVMKLIDGKLDIDWPIEGSKVYFERVRASMRQIANELGATYVDNPGWHLGRVITVHSLGGCPMGRSADEGVVDAWGRVFNYDDLYVADGSVMPGPVGANPSLTIAALADRFADGIIDARRPAT